MIVNPYAEQESLADQIRNYQQIDFPTAMTLADEAIIMDLAKHLYGLHVLALPVSSPRRDCQ